MDGQNSKITGNWTKTDQDHSLYAYSPIKHLWRSEDAGLRGGNRDTSQINCSQVHSLTYNTLQRWRKMNDLLLDYWITKLDLEHFIGDLCVNLSWSLVSFVVNWMGHFSSVNSLTITNSQEPSRISTRNLSCSWTLRSLIRWDAEKRTWHQIEDSKDFSGISQNSDAPSVLMEDKH